MIREQNILKSYFETGDYPTEEQFSDLIDSFVHKNDGSNAVTLGCVFVDPIDGDDTTGVLESQSKPFKTIDAALQSLPAWDTIDNWSIVLIKAGTYEVHATIPRRNLVFHSDQKVVIDMKRDDTIVESAGNDVARIIFNIPNGTYQHISDSPDAHFHTGRVFLGLHCDAVKINNSSASFSQLAYFNISLGSYSYGCYMKINVVETNVNFFYTRKFIADTTNVYIDVEIGKVLIKQGNETVFFTEDVRHDLKKASITIHSFTTQSSNYSSILKVSSPFNKDIYIGDVSGTTNSVFLFSTISTAIVRFMNSRLTNTFFARTWAAWANGYKQLTGVIVMYEGTNAAICQTTSNVGSVVHLKDLFIKEFISNNVNAWIFDLWQNDDARGEWIFENCHIVSNCRTLRNGGSTDRIKLIGTNIFDDAGDTVNFSIDKRLPTYGQFKLINEGVLRTKTIRDTLNDNSEVSVVLYSNLNEY